MYPNLQLRSLKVSGRKSRKFAAGDFTEKKTLRFASQKSPKALALDNYVISESESQKLGGPESESPEKFGDSAALLSCFQHYLTVGGRE